MRHSTEPKYREHDKYGKKLMDTATKKGIDAAKIVVQKTAEAKT